MATFCLSRRVCDERWHNITRSIMRRGSTAAAAMKQPTWCKLPPEKFGLVATRVVSPVPENILLTRSLPAQMDADGALRHQRTASLRSSSPGGMTSSGQAGEAGESLLSQQQLVEAIRHQRLPQEEALDGLAGLQQQQQQLADQAAGAFSLRGGLIRPRASSEPLSALSV